VLASLGARTAKPFTTGSHSRLPWGVVEIDEHHNVDFGGDASECHEANGDCDRHVEAERPSTDFPGDLVLNGLLNRSP